MSEDSRISKLVKRAMKEDERERRLHAVRQLHDFIAAPENSKTVLKVAENLFYSLQDILTDR